MSHSPASAFDDRLLRELAVEPPEPLFPALRHARAMAPLVIVLAFLPTLYAVAYRTLTDDGARQGLISLECLAAQNLNEFIDPAAHSAPTPLAYQPLLMNWLTALGLRLFGVGHAAGYVASAYLCTAGLILAAYVLGRRMGGDRLGLFAALLIAFNPHVLQLAQEPTPQSAAALFAVLALAGTVAHWQKSSALASVQLLLGGISLGLCLLAGGPVALAVVMILLIYAVAWKVDGWRVRSAENVIDRSRLNRRRALRTVLILAATGFAVGGWRSTLMGSRYGGDFWLTWLGSRTAAAGSLVAPASGPGWFTVVVRANYLVFPLSVLALVGAGVIVREMVRRTEDCGRHHRGLILVWLVLAGGWWLARERTGSASPLTEFRTIMLIVPLTLSAAIGLLAIIDREVPALAALMLAFLTCLDIFWLERLASAAGGESMLPNGTGGGFALACFGAAAAIALAVDLAHAATSAEARRRRLLTGAVLGIIAANCAWGAVAVRRAGPGDRELEDLRLALARLPAVTGWTLVVPQQAGPAPAQPPAQLVYALRSLWPTAPMARVNSWDSLVDRLASEDSAESPHRHLIITWSPQGRVRPTVPAGLLQAAAPPCVYREHEVAAYRLGDRRP